MLSRIQRESLGKSIANYYVNYSGIKRTLYRTKSIEPEGEFTVISYPKVYNAEIDRQIAEYYQKKPKIRKRTPIKIQY